MVPHHAILEANEITTRHGIPVTTPERTLLDLATRLHPKALEQAIRQADFHKLVTATSLASSLSRTRTSPASRHCAKPQTKPTSAKASQEKSSKPASGASSESTSSQPRSSTRPCS
jgi:hypothetical protein